MGLATSIDIIPLLPFTQYEVRLQACLRNVLNGCGTSNGTVVTTLEDVPRGMLPPQLTPVSYNTISVEWKPPTVPNGIISKYMIYQRTPGVNRSEILVNEVAGTTLQFTQSGDSLKPYWLYEYKVGHSFKLFTLSAENTNLKVKVAFIKRIYLDCLLPNFCKSSLCNVSIGNNFVFI